MNDNLVYIASPYAGDIEKNTRFARDACRYAIQQGQTPVAVHLLYPQFLDDTDPKQRQAGLFCGMHVLEHCDELWVCGEHISPGMREEINFAEEIGVTVRTVSTHEIQGMELRQNEPEPTLEMT